jgi:hypothetical protein
MSKAWTTKWTRLAESHAKCAQFFLVVHHALLVPSIMVPVVVSLFDFASSVMKYTIVGASAATALSLALKLELRAYVHNRTAREYMLLVLDYETNSDHTGIKSRITLLMREAPLLPSCICGSSTADMTPYVDSPNSKNATWNQREACASDA